MVRNMSRSSSLTTESRGGTISRFWRLVVATFGSCMRYRVTGLAAEAAFFALLSVPPLLFALVGSIGLVADVFSDAQVEEVRRGIISLVSRALTPRAMDRIVIPTLDDVIDAPRFDVVSVGFVLALWSGSRALNVFVDTITIMHGLAGYRGIVKTRALSFGLYVFAMISGALALPLVVAGPTLVDAWLPDSIDWLGRLYWPSVVALSICFLATLYHVSLPIRSSWLYNLPGATFSLLMWVFGSYLLRLALTATAGESRSIYGPLSAPITVLLWLYLVAFAVLIGAAINASAETIFPRGRRARAPHKKLSPSESEAVETTSD
jgi:membrane protein